MKTKKIGRPKKESVEPSSMVEGTVGPDISKQLTDLTDIVLSLSKEVKEAVGGQKKARWG